MFARDGSFGAARAVPVVRAARAGGRFPRGVVLLPALAVALLVATGVRNTAREVNSGSIPGLSVGDSRPIGNGAARAWVRYDELRRPDALGVTFSDAALTGLPDADESGAPACCDVTEYLLKLPRPEGAVATPFDHVAVRWSPRGIGLPGTPDKPVLDVQFHLLTQGQRG